MKEGLKTLGRVINESFRFWVNSPLNSQMEFADV